MEVNLHELSYAGMDLVDVPTNVGPEKTVFVQRF